MHAETWKKKTNISHLVIKTLMYQHLISHWKPLSRNQSSFRIFCLTVQRKLKGEQAD